MPGWHDALLPWRDDDGLAVIGITEEQHPARCRLFAQWKGLDWPILWDPFNLTESKVVPLHVLIDEHGIVRGVNPTAEALEEFLLGEFPAPTTPRAEHDAGATLLEVGAHAQGSFEDLHARALSDLLWRVPGRMDAAVDTLERQAIERADDPRYAFRAGVARRMRYDSVEREPGDFQAALDHWTRALAGDPNQYIWRRRIQQYGPRMDKPYPFYDWIATAQREITARGEVPCELRAALTPVELAQPADFRAGDGGASEPDPSGRIQRADDGWIAVESAVAFDTSASSRVASLHFALRPRAGRAHWNNEAEPTIVWLDADAAHGRLDRQLLESTSRPTAAVSDELRSFTAELELADGVDTAVVRGYALTYVCEDVDGTCLFVRRDFAVEVTRP